jgi:PAS domain S-box-containing protein
VGDTERARHALLSVLEDQQKIEGRLRESETNYRHLFERNPAPMLVYARDGLRVLAINEAFSDHYGYSRDEALALELTDLYPQHEKQAVTELAASLSGLAFVGEWHHLKRDGRQITIEARSHDIEYQGHRARIAVITDITERKLAEQALADSEERLRLALEAANQGLYDLDLGTGEAVVSPEYARMLGYEPELFRETNAAWQERLHPDDRARVAQVYEDYIAGRITEYRVECRQRTKNGDWKWILSLGKIQARDAAGQPLRMLGTHTDITQQKQTESALDTERQEASILANLIERSSQPLAIGYADGRLGRTNQAFLDLIGYSREELDALDWAKDLTPARWNSIESEAIAKLTRTGQPVRYEKEYVRKDGSIVPIELYTHIVADGSEDAPYYFAFVTDITARKHAEQEIRNLNEELEDRVKLRTRELEIANKELETFTYSVSHDLKAPLRGIDGYSRLLMEDHLDRIDDEGRQFLANVRHGVEQMSRLIEDLLAYSRMERRSMQDSEVDLRQQVDAILHELRAELSAGKVTTNVELDALTVHADPNGLTMVLRNLVDNALKFSRDSQPPVVTITGWRKTDTVIVEIKDNGIGFDMRFHDRIFDIFQRLQRTEDYPGTGVGLAIVRKAMQRMGGRVWAQSTPGEGACFMLELPR